MARLEAELAKLDKLRRKARARKDANKARAPVRFWEQSSTDPDSWHCDRPDMTLTTAQVEALQGGRIVMIYKNVGSGRKGYKK